MYVTSKEFADVGETHCPAPLSVAKGLISTELVQESVIWFNFVVASALCIAFVNEHILYPWT